MLPGMKAINLNCDIANTGKEWVLAKVWGVPSLYVIPEGSRKKNIQAVGFGRPSVMREVAKALLAMADEIEAEGKSK